MIDASSRLQPSISFSVTAPANAKNIVTHNQSGMPRNNQRGVQHRPCRVYRRQDVARSNHGFQRAEIVVLDKLGRKLVFQRYPKQRTPVAKRVRDM